MKHCISNRINFIIEAEAPFTRQAEGGGCCSVQHEGSS
jgi:hypothetical protein